LSDKETLLVIAGCARYEEESPFIVGAFNEEYLNQLPIEDADAQILALKKTWTHDPAEYEWREIRVSIPTEALDRSFDRVAIEAEVETS
jgi:hypothetical protein